MFNYGKLYYEVKEPIILKIVYQEIFDHMYFIVARDIVVLPYTLIYQSDCMRHSQLLPDIFWQG